jgi:hypothetical protein
LKYVGKISNDPWWDADRLRSGTLWDEPAVCKKLLSSKQAAQKTLINAVKELHRDLNQKGILPKALRRKLLILSLVIKYLEERKVFEGDFFGRFRPGATKFFEVLADGPALVKLLGKLEDRFNGHVFTLTDEEQQALADSNKLTDFARFVEARQERGGQLTLWQRYSFADLPVELISHIYQLFVKDKAVAVYTPHFVVRMMLGEVLSWERLDRLEKNDEVILDGACGSGVFLVEAYKRLVLHWRYRHGWNHPTAKDLKNLLTSRLRGVDLEPGAVELSAFSLCLTRTVLNGHMLAIKRNTASCPTNRSPTFSCTSPWKCWFAAACSPCSSNTIFSTISSRVGSDGNLLNDGMFGKFLISFLCVAFSRRVVQTPR